MIGKQSRLFFLVSLCGLMLAILLATWGIPRIVRSQIQKNVQIDPSSQMFEKWRKLPMPLTFKVYVFNVTNADEVTDGAKPQLEEIGPYVYKQYRERTILGYGVDDTVEYTLKKTFVLDQNETGSLSEDDEVTVINFTYMAVLLQVQALMPSLVEMINGGLGEMFTNLTDPFLRVKVKDLFFDGIHLNCAGENSALSLVCSKMKSDQPATMRHSEDGNGFYFSMFSHMNLSESGPYQMVRGTQDLSELGHIVSYKGKKQMKNWGDPYCNQLNGSDASVFPPVTDKPIQRLYTFEPEVCRSLYANLVGESSIFNMRAMYYEIGEEALAAKTANPANKCFCRKNWSANHDGCLLMGILNLEPCQGAPALASLPHFYLASEELLEYFDGGISPDKEKHNTYVFLDPVTGVVLKGVRRLQFNIELRQIKGIPQLEKVRTGVFPLLWIDEGAELPDDIQQELRQSHSLIGYVEMGRWILLSVAILVLLASVIKLTRSGGLPMCNNNNSVSFVLSANGNGNKLR